MMECHQVLGVGHTKTRLALQACKRLLHQVKMEVGVCTIGDQAEVGTSENIERGER